MTLLPECPADRCLPPRDCSAALALPAQCSAARCSESAAAIRQQLAEGVPTRLLLPPLLAHLEPAAQVPLPARRRCCLPAAAACPPLPCRSGLSV